MSKPKNYFVLTIKLICVLITCSAICFFVIIYNLIPSPSEIANELQFEKTKNNLNSTKKIKMQENAKDNLSIYNEADNLADNKINKVDQEQPKEKDYSLYSMRQAIQNLENDYWLETPFCENLYKMESPINSNSDLTSRIELIGENQLEKDPYWLLLNMHYRAMFSSPHAKAVGQMILDSTQESDHPQILNKMNFITHLFNAIEETRQNAKYIETIGQQAYSLYIASRIAYNHPEVLNDEYFKNFCNKAEQFTKGESDEYTSIDDIGNLLTKFKIDPKEVHFNPNLAKTKVISQRSGYNVKFLISSPWVDEIIESQEYSK